MARGPRTCNLQVMLHPSPNGRQLRILIVDDSQEFRDAARAVLEQRGYLVTGEADTGAAAIHAIGRLAPDGILLDVGLPDTSGFEVSAVLTHASPPPAVLMTSVSDAPGYPVRARASGARGFILKRDLAATNLEQFWPRP
jgi:DNA-binding NarL/FixJ family response regulator